MIDSESIVEEIDSPVLTTSPRRGKVVIQHTSGKLTGMYRIMGDQKDAPDPYPDFLPDVDMVTHRAPVGLVAVKRSYVLYREVIDPANGTSFHKGQR